MTDSKTASEEVDKSFVVVTTEVTTGQARQMLSAAGAAYCVVLSGQGEPLALATSEQLEELPDQDRALSAELESLPDALPVEGEWTITQIVDNFTTLLFGERRLRGLVVFTGGQVEGVIPRRKVAEYSGARFRVRGIAAEGIEGDPVHLANTYVCSQGDYEEEVDFYNRHHPPRCPTHKTLLVRKR